MARAKAGVLLGIAISFPVTFGIGVPYVYWLLTGRGPWKRYGFSSAVVVNPFSRGTRVELRAALAELPNEWASTACAVPARARPLSLPSAQSVSKYLGEHLSAESPGDPSDLSSVSSA